MKQHIKAILTLMAISALIICMVWTGRSRRQRSVHISKAEITSGMINTAQPIQRGFSVHLDWFGKVESKRDVRIISLVSGKIIKAVTDGTYVRKGDILFILGGPQIAHRLGTLKKQVQALKKQRTIVKDLVQTRYRAVAERIAKREDLLSAQEDLARLDTRIIAARSKLSAFRDALLVRSPIDGVFINRKVSIGQDVEQGTYLGDVISKDLRIIAYLFPEKGIDLAGKKAQVSTGSNKKITGTVVRVLPEKTAEGATVIWIEGREISCKLKPNEMVSGWIVLETRKGLAIPEDAIVRDKEGHTFVFMKTKNGYEKKEIKTGLYKKGWYEVISGLSPDDEVVISGAYELFYRRFAKGYKVED